MRKLKAALHVVEVGDHGLTVRGRPQPEIIGDLVQVAVGWIAGLR